jgi:hypothetical protein
MVIAADPKNGVALGLWIGPFRILDYLCHLVQDQKSRPPDSPGLYLLSQRRWQHLPDGEAGALYVGQAKYLRYRVGQFLSDLLGFTGDDPAEEEAYQHRGGHQLWHRYCVAREIEPANLYLAWRTLAECLNCAEAKLSELLPREWRLSTLRTCSQHNRGIASPDGDAAVAVAHAASHAKNGSTA